MPPLKVVASTILADHQDGHVVIKCNNCDHEREISALALANIIGGYVATGRGAEVQMLTSGCW